MPQMRSGPYIQQKLQAWAQRKGIPLQGSAGDRGEPNYTLSVGQNILGGELHPSVRAAFDAGAGGELRGSIPTMSALHSSAALAVNLFQYWLVRGDWGTIATLLAAPSGGIASGRFEDPFHVCEDSEAHGFTVAPHLDFALRYKDGSRVGVECKLFEPYGRLGHALLKPAYLALPDAWTDIPACRALAEQLAVSAADFHRLGAAQLVKHILGLKFQAPIDTVRLIYLYCDAIGDEAAEHRDEIRRFQAAIAGDPISFVPMSVQEFILRAVRRVRADHTAYVDYLAERYL
jgi:hypothetical protein